VEGAGIISAKAWAVMTSKLRLPHLETGATILTWALTRLPGDQISIPILGDRVDTARLNVCGQRGSRTTTGISRVVRAWYAL
jgi:hypothetical protein